MTICSLAANNISASCGSRHTAQPMRRPGSPYALDIDETLMARGDNVAAIGKAGEPCVRSRYVSSTSNTAPERSAVSTNARNHRMDADVPLLIPEVNGTHVEAVAAQRARRRSEGFIVANPNCSTIVLTLALKPLQDAFGLERVMVTTLQALSGAGYPGVPSLDILDNVLPHIGGEEDKMETEPRKILGTWRDGAFVDASVLVSAACNRVSTADGHLECVSVDLGLDASPDEVTAALRAYRSPLRDLGLPGAPDPVVIVRAEPDRPQPRLDRDAGQGMAVTVGRVRPCPILDYKFVALGHNTVRGAAGGAILNAELLYARGLLG